jgi:hypothetical protein
MRLLLLLTLLSGCGAREPVPTTFASPELRDLTNQFIRDAKAHGREPHLSNVAAIKWSNLPGKVRGRCLLKVDRFEHVVEGAGEVRLSKEFFEKSSQCGKKLLVYHELVHCLFDAEGHSSEYGSLMYPYLAEFESEEACEEIISNYWEGK